MPWAIVMSRKERKAWHKAERRASPRAKRSTTISRGETPLIDLQVGGDKISIPSPFPSSFAVEVESSRIEKGVPIGGLVS